MKESQSVLKGSVLLIASAILAKILGAVFRIPLTLMLGGTGMGYFSCAYSLFLPVFALSVTGINTAVSAVIAHAPADADPHLPERVRHLALRMFGTVGAVCSAALYVLSAPLCAALGNPQAALSVKMLAPAVFFCCISAVLRGVHEGMHNMLPTAVSQVAEGIGRVGFGLLLCRFAMLSGSRLLPCPDRSVCGAAAAVLGVTLSAAAGLVTLLCFPSPHGNIKREPSDRELCRQLLRILLPVAAASLVTNLTTLIDLCTGLRLLAAAIRRSPALAGTYAAGTFPDPADAANFCYGAFSGLAVTVFNLVPSVTNMLGKGVFPAFAKSTALHNTSEAAAHAETVIRRTAFLAVPAGCGITVLAQPILSALFASRPTETEAAAPCLMLLGGAVICSALSFPVFSMMQAAGYAGETVTVMLWGAAAKLLGNLLLIPLTGMRGAALAASVCYFVILLLAVRRFRICTGIRLRLLPCCIRSLTGGLLCAFTALTLYAPLLTVFPQRIALVCTIGAGGMVYLVCMLLLNRLFITKNYEICT